MSDERSMYVLAGKALEMAQAAEGCIKNFPHMVDEAQAGAGDPLAGVFSDGRYRRSLFKLQSSRSLHPMTDSPELPEWATSWAGRTKCKVHGTRLVWVDCGYGDSHRVCLETAREDSECRP